jgi:AraC family transcriptional regulator
MTAERPDEFRANWLVGHLPGKLLARAEAGPGHLTVHLLEHQTIEAPVRVPAVADPLLVWIAAGTARVEERSGTQELWRTVEVGTGDLFVVDSDEPYELRWTAHGASFQALHVYLGAPLIEAAADAVYGRRQRPRLREPSGVRDADISALLQVMFREITRVGPSANLALNGLGEALAVYVLRAFTDTTRRISRRGLLPAARLRAVDQHMRSHLADPFSLATLASIAGSSPFHFSRMFSRSTGVSPESYFIALRITEARRLLSETDLPVIEIALTVGYSSPSHFAQTFRRATGKTPTQFRGVRSDAPTRSSSSLGAP